MDNFRNDEESKKKLIKKQRAAFLVSLITLLSISFCASYFITDYITNPNRKNANIDEENENEEVDEVVILKVDHNADDEDSFVTVDDEDELNEVFEEFKARMEDEYDFDE